MAGHYWAYRDVAGVRSAWVQLVCHGCMAPTMEIVRKNRQGYDGCIVDGQQALTEDALHTVWLTLYLPGRAPGVFQVDLCDDCLDPSLAEFRANSRLLPDRRGGDGGPPTPAPQDPWGVFDIGPSGST
jgi:hypothetical protein